MPWAPHYAAGRASLEVPSSQRRCRKRAGAAAARCCTARETECAMRPPRDACRAASHGAGSEGGRVMTRGCRLPAAAAQQLGGRRKAPRPMGGRQGRQGPWGAQRSERTVTSCRRQSKAGLGCAGLALTRREPLPASPPTPRRESGARRRRGQTGGALPRPLSRRRAATPIPVRSEWHWLVMRSLLL